MTPNVFDDLMWSRQKQEGQYPVHVSVNQRLNSKLCAMLIRVDEISMDNMLIRVRQ